MLNIHQRRIFDHPTLRDLITELLRYPLSSPITINGEDFITLHDDFDMHTGDHVINLSTTDDTDRYVDENNHNRLIENAQQVWIAQYRYGPTNTNQELVESAYVIADTDDDVCVLIEEYIFNQHIPTIDHVDMIRIIPAGFSALYLIPYELDRIKADKERMEALKSLNLNVYTKRIFSVTNIQTMEEC